MTAAFLQHSVLKLSGCRIRSFSSIRSASAGCSWVSSSIQPISFGSLSQVLGSYGFKHSNAPISIRSVSASVKNDRGTAVDRIENQSVEGSVSKGFSSIQFSDAEPIALWRQNPDDPIRVFVLDTETTGFSPETERIIEFGIRDLSGGKNSCLESLINPDKHIRNSHTHHITNDMVNSPEVPRMEDFIPVLMSFIADRTKPEESVLLVAHNARNFDARFLIEEFRRCSVAFPCDWQVFDTLPPARELRRSLLKKGLNALPVVNLIALSEYYHVEIEGSAHRAMTDANMLARVLKGMIRDLKLTPQDLLQRSFKVSELKKKTKKENDALVESRTQDLPLTKRVL